MVTVGAPERWDADLLVRWQVLAADLTLAPGHQGVARRVMAAYGEPHRHYHTKAHLAAVLTVLDQLWSGGGSAPASSRAAAWFHDVVYDTHRDDNEEASARLAATELGNVGAASQTIRAIELLILATKTHRLAGVVPGAGELLDADLAILGAPADRYDLYADAIRQEYGHLDDESFRSGRAAVLATLLERPQLFFTEPGRRRFEAGARANLERELAALADR
jgi:predicted metal-dependent HD superfamily phosphohydrolase